MTLIDEIFIDNVKIKFYDGIDFNLATNHPKDGSEGFIYFFIDSWSSEVISRRRNDKIDSILNGEPLLSNEELNNNYIVIYQTGGDFRVYETIRTKLDNRFPWMSLGVLPIIGYDKK